MGEAPAPQHSVSVAGVVIDRDDRALAVQRRDNAHWELPGGILERGETFEQGVAREVYEETGIRVHVDQLTGVYKNMTRGVVALVYRCRPVAGLPQPTAESRRVRWLRADAVRELMAPAYAIRILDALRDDNESPASRAHDGYDLIDEPHTAAELTS